MGKPVQDAYYDVVVIGAGVGGLTAAALLSKAGLSVCVIEKEPHVGGYLAGFKRKQFHFDTAIHWLNQYGKSGMVTRLFALLGKDHPVAIPQKRIRRYKGNGYNYLLTDNPDLFRDQLIADFPQEEKGIKRFFKKAKRIGKSLEQFNTIFRSDETMGFAEKWSNKLRMLKFALPFIPYITYTGENGLKRGLNKFFRDPGLHRIFNGEAELIGCMVPIGWAYYGDFQSPPKGGGQMIPAWLKMIIKSHGGEVNCLTTVTAIEVENGIVRGVNCRYRNETMQLNCKYVIAANDIETLYEKLLPGNLVPAKLKTKLKTAELYSSSVTISIALDCEAELLGFDEEMVHLADESGHFSHSCNGDPKTSEISILSASARDKTMAPLGKGTLTIFMPADIQYMDFWKTERDEQGNFIRGDAYRQLKEETAWIIIKRVEAKFAPGLSEKILFMEIATPVTHYRYTGNRNGTMMGARPGKANMQAKIAHYQTPVENLFLGGHWAELGGGVPIAAKAGANASLMVLRKEKPSHFKLMSGYMDGKFSLEEYHQMSKF